MERPLSSKAASDYAAAYDAHYKTNDLHNALVLYKGIMSEYPREEEAKYAYCQIQNIVKSVVPERAIFEAQVSLALAYFDEHGHVD